MFAEDPRLDRDAIAAVLRSSWGIDTAPLTYVPVGFGTHHYLAQDGERKWFVNVDVLTDKTFITQDPDGAFVGLDHQLRVARALRDTGLEFVHAPLAADDGTVLVRVGQCAVSVFDHLEGRSSNDGEYTSDDERLRVLDVVRRIHAATDALDLGSVHKETYAVPGRARFLTLLDDLDREWSGGPFSQAVRDVMRERKTDVLERLTAFDELVARVEASSPAFVVTHGEPHAANVMWTDDGMRLIDWDTVALGPRERDLWMLAPVEDADPAVMELFERRWSLWEIAGYTVALHDAHIDDANTRTAWKGLNGYLDAPR